MSNKKIEVDLLANPKEFVKGLNQASQHTATFADRLNKLGPVGKGFAGVLDKLGLSSLTTAQGLAGMGVAVAGVAAVAVEKAISNYVALADKIRNYSLITGQSAEVSSRQVQAFAELGVSEETVASGMVKLSKAIELTPKKLAAVGIEVAKDSKGNVDLGATLLNVVDAYHATGDAAKKNEILITAFGKGGAAMIPILEADTAELKKLEAQVNKVYTAKDLEAARQYGIEQKHLSQSAGDFWNSIAQQAVPALAQLLANTNAESYASKRLNEDVAAGRITRDEYNRATENGLSPSNRLVKAYEDEYRAAGQAKDKTDQLAQAQRAAADAAQAEAAAEDKLYVAIEKNVSAEFAYEQSLIDLKKAQQAVADEGDKDQAAVQRVADATANYTQALRAHGAASRQAKDAAVALRTVRDNLTATGEQAVQDNLRLREAYVKVADAAVDLAMQQATVEGSTLSASEKADIYRAKLAELAGQLALDSPLRKQLQGYIDELNSIPAAKTTTIGFEGMRPGPHGALAFDEGGVVPGMPGAAVPAVVHGGEVVLNKDQQRALGSGGKAAPTIVINIEGYYSDGPGLDRLANAIARRLSYVTGR